MDELTTIPEQRRENHCHLLACRLPTDVKAFVPRRRNLRKVNGRAADLRARGQSLQQPADQHDDRSQQTECGVSGSARDGKRAEGHQPQSHQQPSTASAPVHIRADDDRSDWPHQEPSAKHRKREHQRREFAFTREVRTADPWCVVSEHHEVIHIQKIAAGDEHYRLDQLSTIRTSQHCIAPAASD